MPSTTSATDQTTRGFAAQLPRNLAANIAYFLVNVATRGLLVLRFSRYHLTRSSQNYSPAFFLRPNRTVINLSQNFACTLSPSPNPRTIPRGEAF